MDTVRVESVKGEFKGMGKTRAISPIDRYLYLGTSTCNAVKFKFGEKGTSLQHG